MLLCLFIFIVAVDGIATFSTGLVAVDDYDYGKDVNDNYGDLWTAFDFI